MSNECCVYTIKEYDVREDGAYSHPVVFRSHKGASDFLISNGFVEDEDGIFEFYEDYFYGQSSAMTIARIVEVELRD